MPQPDGLPTDAWMDARVEAYIDDALPPAEQNRFDARLQVDPHWQDQVERARAIRGALKTQSSPPAPSSLAPSIFERIAADASPTPNDP